MASVRLILHCHRDFRFVALDVYVCFFCRECIFFTPSTCDHAIEKLLCSLLLSRRTFLVSSCYPVFIAQSAELVCFGLKDKRSESEADDGVRMSGAVCSRAGRGERIKHTGSLRRVTGKVALPLICMLTVPLRRLSVQSSYLSLTVARMSSTAAANGAGPSVPRPSASLIVVNHRNEILLVQRNPKSRSFAGAHVRRHSLSYHEHHT